MLVYVVMENDFPRAVYKSKEATRKFVDAKKMEEKAKAAVPLERRERPGFWHFYEFTLKE